MANITFGKLGMSMPTPSGVSNGMNITAAVCGVLISWISTASFIPSHLTTVLTSILGLIVALVLALKPFFGVKDLPQKVDVEDVKSVDENAADK